MSLLLKRTHQSQLKGENVKKVKIIEETAFPFEFLPNDVILHIIKFLPATDIVSFSLFCFLIVFERNCVKSYPLTGRYFS
jgi:hypothetical protein